MRIWTVQAQGGGPPEAPDLVLVKEGFAWPALLFGPFWFAWHGLWRAVAVYVALLAASGAGFLLLDPGETVETLFALALAVLFAAEANDLRRAALARRGYRFAGLVQAGKLAEAEHRALGHWPPPHLVAGAP